MVKKYIPFMRYRLYAVLVSFLLVCMSIGSLAVRGLNFGLDFTGGTQLELNFDDVPNLGLIRAALSQEGWPNNEVIFFGDDRNVLIRLQTSDTSVEEAPRDLDSTTVANKVTGILNAKGMSATLKGSGFVSSLVGEELKEQGGLGMLVALGMIMIYIALRFQFKFSVGAVISLAHDTIIVLGFFSFFQLNFDLTVLAAVLAVIGYSLNDTIVVADRIRENFRIMRSLSPEELIDAAINQTLARSVITSLTTLLVLVALYYFGGEVVRGFSIALIVGIFFGTTSSIYVAAAILLYMNISKEDMLPPERDDEELDAMP
jgi:preprotein translocase subunit SecF